MIELTVKRALGLAAKRAGDKIALRCGRHHMTHRELDVASNRLGRALLSQGLARGQRVAVVLPNCMEYVAIALACAKAGLTMVTLNYRFTTSEHAIQLQDCSAELLIYDAAYMESVVPAAQQVGVKYFWARGTCPQGHESLESIWQSGDSADLDTSVSEWDVFYLGYTSGTTGRPKGAMISQRNRSLAYHYWALEFGLLEKDISLHCGPFHHTAPFTFTLTQLYLGGQVVILEQFDAELALRQINEHRVSWMFAVPFMYERILALSSDHISAYNTSSLRMMISGGSALATPTKEGILKNFPKCELHEFYGATEAGVITNLRPPDQVRKRRCVGRPVLDTEVSIRNESGQVLPVGEIGEIWLRGPTIFSGYHEAPEKNKAVFDGDWCTLGDVGRLDDEGYLYIVDRSKDVIKSGGVNIYPIEIEEVILSLKGVLEVAVVGVTDSQWGEAVHAVIVTQADVSLDSKVLMSHCRNQLAGYKVPKSIEFRSELPRNANGKVLKRVLREECSRSSN
jgi:acyl-CoA synthetase (AMP-forming)/AMP-acid ligase II